MRLKLQLLLRLLVISFLFSSCKARESSSDFPHQSSDLTPYERVEYGKLANGLRFAVMANETPSNTASLLMRIDTGSINEADDEQGIAHFLEHMAFNGSDNVPEDEMIKRLEKFGLAFGPDTNASTDFTETIYQLELPEVNMDIINETLFLMRETASNLTLAPDAIDRERGIILSEKRARNSAAYKSSLASLSYYLDGSLFPQRIPIGTDATINSVTAEQFRAFYNGYYRPENTFIVLVGDFEPDYGARKIEEYFGDWEASGDPKDGYETITLGPRDMDAAYYVDPEIRTSVTINVLQEPDTRTDSSSHRKQFYIESLGNRILSRRLAALAQTVDAPFIGAGASTSTVYDTINISSLSLSAKPADWAAALSAGEQELRRAFLYGFSKSELDEQIANTRNALEVAVQTAQTRRTPGLARQIMGNFSSDTVYTAPEYDLEFFSEYAHNITPEQVHIAFKRQWAGYEAPQIYLSTSEIIEDAETKILSVYRESAAIEVDNTIKEDLGTFAYTDFGPVGEVTTRERIEDIGIETITFDNNVRLNIKKTPYQKNTVNITILFGQGELGLPSDRPGMRWFAPNIMSVGGLEAHSADDMRSLMAGKTVGASISLGSKRAFLSGSTTPDDLPEQLNLMTAYLSAPGYREEAMARYRKLIESFYPTLDSTPGGVASRDISRLIRSGDTRFGIPPEDELLGIEIAELKDWITPLLERNAIEIGIVGDVDIDQVIAEVARTVGALPKRELDPPSYGPDKTRLSFPKGSNRPTILSHAGEPDTAQFRVYWPGPDGQSDITVRELNVLQAIFKNRLNDILREELGSTYSPSASSYASRTYPGYGYFAASVELNPKDINIVQRRVFDIAADIKAGNISEDEYDRAITPIRENIETSLESNSYWMDVIKEAQTDPVRLDWHRRRMDSYAQMTLADIKNRAAGTFEKNKAVIFHILPEK